MQDDTRAIKDLLTSLSSNPKSGPGYEGPVLKLGKGGCCFNSRYLIIRQGTITYFRDSPLTLNFIKNASKTALMPKGQVSARLCDYKPITSNIFARKKHPNMFEISFISPANKSKRIIWAFAVFSEDQLNTWIATLNEEKERDLIMSQKDREAQRLLDEEIRKELLQRKLREESKLRVNEFERKKVRLKEKQLDEERKKLEVDFEIKRLQQEAEEKRQMELASKKRETYAKLLEYSWDYQFQKLWTQSLQEPTSFENSLTYGIRFYKHLGVFVAKSTEVFRLLVNELAFPLHSRQLHPYQVLERPNILRYRYQNLQIQVVKRSECEQWKTFGHELRANESVLESVYTSSKSGNSCNLRVELSCIVDYKGFRGLVTAKAPLEGERTLVHGPKSDGVYIGHPAVYSGLSGIAKDLRLREHNFEWNETVGPAYVHLSAFSELHKSLGYRDLESYILETLGKNEEELTGY